MNLILLWFFTGMLTGSLLGHFMGNRTVFAALWAVGFVVLSAFWILRWVH